MARAQPYISYLRPDFLDELTEAYVAEELQRARQHTPPRCDQHGSAAAGTAQRGGRRSMRACATTSVE